MSDAARLSDAEVHAITERLAARPLPRDASAIARRPIADATRTRRGLAPIVEADAPKDEAPERDLADPPLTRNDDRAATLLDIDYLIRHALRRERKSSHRTMDEVVEAVAAFIAETVIELRREFGRTPETPDAPPAKVAELELENAKLRASAGELAAKVGQLDFIVERLRVEARGSAGPPGPRGRDGADGQRGPRGERGAMGPAGPRIIGWEIDDSAFVAAPLTSPDGRKGAPLSLRGMFENFNDQINDADVAEEADAAAASRAAIEREAAAVRLGLPSPRTWTGGSHDRRRP